MKNLAREERRLQRALEKAMWLAIGSTPMVVAVACSAPKPSSTEGSGGSGAGQSQATTDTSGTQSETATGPATGSGGAGGASTSSGIMDGGSCNPENFTPNPPDDCGVYVHMPCGLPPGVMAQPNCYLTLKDCHNICPASFFNCHSVGEYCTEAGVIVPDQNGNIDIDCSVCANGIGRIPAGLARARASRGRSALGDYFAVASHLEAASVVAFQRMQTELCAHGAPRALVLAARRAERDEVRHARMTARIARRHGGKPVAPKVEEMPVRSLDAIAIENAVEGCVNETFGALIATVQAARAEDPSIARAMKSIARDETRHAALSWAVMRWTTRRIGEGAKRELKARCHAAIEALRGGAGGDVAEGVAATAGLPNAVERRALLEALERELFSKIA